MPPRHIGIVACSTEGAALCYRTISLVGGELMGRHAHPEVSLHSAPLSEYMELIYRGAWDGVAASCCPPRRSWPARARTFLICPDNTLHIALPEVRAALAAALAAHRRGGGGGGERRGYRRLG
jgi:aspartate racemase